MNGHQGAVSSRSTTTMSTVPAHRDQPSDAQHLYDDRASRYDDSWHPRFARHMVELADLKPGEYVLDLACGTGLVSLPAGEAVGSSGSVVGIDISSGMLAQAETKLSSHSLGNVKFYQHSIKDLETLAVLKEHSFDVIICASALVLLEDPAEAIEQWTSFLKLGGRMIVDVTHPRSQISLITFERVGRLLGRPLPFYRVPFQSPNDLEDLMRVAGLQNIETKFLSQMSISGTDQLKDYIVEELEGPRIAQTFHAGDADILFEKHITSWAASSLASDDIRDIAKETFRREWQKLDEGDGKIREVDGVFIGIGWK